jgi:hypothetical protein
MAYSLISLVQNLKLRRLSIPRPDQTQFPSSPVRRPDGVRVVFQEICISILRAILLENLQVPSKDSFELRPICSAIRLARIVQNAVGVGEVPNASVCYDFCRFNIGIVSGGTTELGKSA